MYNYARWLNAFICFVMLICGAVQSIWAVAKWHLPQGVNISPNAECTVNLPHSYNGKAELEYEISAEFINGSKLELVIDISSEGRHSRGFVPVTLYQ